MAYSILIVDDHSLIRSGLSDLIRVTLDDVTTMTASSHKEAVILLRKQPFNLVIMDISLPDGNGIEIIQNLRDQFRETRWLVLTSSAEQFYMVRARDAGACGFIDKTTGEDEIISAIRIVMSGGTYPKNFLTNAAPKSDNCLERLSNREMTVFQLIATGNTVQQIASSLCRSTKTINALRDRIRSKLDIGSSAELSRFATCWFLDKSG